MSDNVRRAQVLPEPGREEGRQGGEGMRAIWMRGLWVLLMAVLFELSKIVLFVSAVVQFGWQVINKEKNRPIADFGVELAKWQGAAVRFMTGASEARPFPFARWGAVEKTETQETAD